MLNKILNNKKFVALFFIEIFFLSAIQLDAADFEPGVSIGNVLGNPVIQSLLSKGAWFIVIIFVVVMAKNMFKFVSGGGDVNWLSFIFKFVIIFFLYNNAVWVVTTFTNKVIVKTAISDTDRLNAAFSKLDVALVKLAMGDPEQLDENKSEKGTFDQMKDAFSDISRVFSFQTILCFIFSIIAKGMITLTMITKIGVFCPFPEKCRFSSATLI